MPDYNIDREALEKARERMNSRATGSEPVDTDRPFADRPGVLRGESTLTIKTNLAQQLVFGRPASKSPAGKRAIIGLVGFAGMLKPIYAAARLDDPYADKWLLDIEACLERSAQNIAELRATVDQLLASRSDVQHTVAQSVRPLQVPLYFSNQFPFRAAYLINDFDTLMCAVQTARHVAVVTTTNANTLVRRGSKTVRRALASATGYQFTGVSRADIVHGTAKGHAAVRHWGELPLDILDGTRRAEFGPPLPEGSFAPQIVGDPHVAVEATD